MGAGAGPGGCGGGARRAWGRSPIRLGGGAPSGLGAWLYWAWGRAPAGVGAGPGRQDPRTHPASTWAWELTVGAPARVRAVEELGTDSMAESPSSVHFGFSRTSPSQGRGAAGAFWARTGCFPRARGPTRRGSEPRLQLRRQAAGGPHPRGAPRTQNSLLSPKRAPQQPRPPLGPLTNAVNRHLCSGCVTLRRFSPNRCFGEALKIKRAETPPKQILQ